MNQTIVEARRLQHERHKAIRSRIVQKRPAPLPAPAPAPEPLPLPAFPLARVFVATARHFGLTLGDLRVVTHAHRIVHPRQIAFFLARKRTAKSLPEIGAYAGKDHTTVLHGARAVEKRIAAGHQPTIDAVAAIEAAYDRH